MTSAIRKIDPKFGDRIIENLQRLIHNELAQALSSILKHLETVESHVDSEGRPIWKIRDDLDSNALHFDSYKQFLKADMRRGLAVSPTTLSLMIELKESLENARSDDPLVKLKLAIQELTDEHVRSLLESEGAPEVSPVSNAELIGYLSSHRDLVFRSYLASCAQYSQLFSANAISRALTELFEISR